MRAFSFEHLESGCESGVGDEPEEDEVAEDVDPGPQRAFAEAAEGYFGSQPVEEVEHPDGEEQTNHEGDDNQSKSPHDQVQFQRPSGKGGHRAVNHQPDIDEEARDEQAHRTRVFPHQLPLVNARGQGIEHPQPQPPQEKAYQREEDYLDDPVPHELPEFHSDTNLHCVGENKSVLAAPQRLLSLPPKSLAMVPQVPT